jgi:hypothetical protein
VVIEDAGAGTDFVQSSVSYALGANIENLTLTGTAAIDGSGNELNNVIIGNAGANALSGGMRAMTALMAGRAMTGSTVGSASTVWPAARAPTSISWTMPGTWWSKRRGPASTGSSPR